MIMDKLEKFYRLTKDEHVRRVHKVMKGNVTDAEDVVQSAFIKAFKNFSNYDENKGPIGAWFSTILFRTMIDEIRKNKKHSLISLEIVKDFLSTEEESVIREIEECICSILNCYEKDILLRHYIQGETYASIADDLGCSTSSVKRVCKNFRIRFLKEHNNGI